MHKKNDVYAYIVEQIDKLLVQGIHYYQHKDEKLKTNLIEMQNHLKSLNQVCEQPKPQVVKKDVDKHQVDTLTKDFMNKLAKIKIDVLSLDMEDYPHHPPVVKEKLKPVARTSVFSSFLEKLNLEDFTTIAVDDPNTYHPDDNSANRNSKLHSLDLTPLAAHPKDSVNVNPTPMMTEDMDEEFWKDNFDMSTSLEDFSNMIFDDKKE